MLGIIRPKILSFRGDKLDVTIKKSEIGYLSVQRWWTWPIEDYWTRSICYSEVLT